MRLKRNLCTTALLLTAMAAAVSFPAGKVQPQETRKAYRQTGHEGIVTGTVLFAGKVPAARRIDTSGDPACRINNPNPITEWVVVNNGHLANVFVYIKAGAALDDLSFDTPSEPVVIDQQGCRFVPHVVGVQTNQIVEFVNSDPTTHNVHPQPKYNEEWRQSRVSGAPPLRKKFSQPEVMIPIKSDQHPWMKVWVGVVSHPFFSVSDSEGAFRIEGLPPGHYTIAAWHEQLGEKTTEVSIQPLSQRHLNFEFNSEDSWPHLRRANSR